MQRIGERAEKIDTNLRFDSGPEIDPPRGEKNENLRKLKLIVCFKQKGNANKFLLIQLTNA